MLPSHGFAQPLPTSGNCIRRPTAASKLRLYIIHVMLILALVFPDLTTFAQPDGAPAISSGLVESAGSDELVTPAEGALAGEADVHEGTQPPLTLADMEAEFQASRDDAVPIKSLPDLPNLQDPIFSATEMITSTRR